jgi:transcriptional regulator with GAF, ATPase, and Fis domain
MYLRARFIDGIPRRGRPFVVISCMNLAMQLLENELFGHVRERFIGAVNKRAGRIEAAHGGTVLFDEPPA